MKLCIPVRAPNGLDSCVEPHLPAAEHLLFFDTETRVFEQIALRGRPQGAEQPAFDAVLCASFDTPTRELLQTRGIVAFGTEAPTVADAIAEFEALNPSAPRTASGSCGSGGCGGQTKKEASGCDGKGGCGGQGGCGGGHDHAHDDDHAHGGGCGGGRRDAATDAFARKAHADALRIAVSSQNRKTVTDHAGRCRKFWVYEVRENRVDGKTLRELTQEQTFHAAELNESHPLDDVHVLITAGMSPYLFQRLQRGGIKPYITEESDPDRAVQLLLERVARA